MLAIGQVSEGTQVRMARVAIGWSLYELGARTGILPPRLSEWERGRIALPPATVARVRDVLINAGAPLAADADGEAA